MDRAREALRPGGTAGTVLLTAPEMVPLPGCYRRADGLSLWRRHGAGIYTTRAMLDTETRLLRAAAQTGAPKLEPDRAAVALMGVEEFNPAAASAATSSCDSTRPFLKVRSAVRTA